MNSVYSKNTVAVIGSGPAGLMAAEVLSSAGLRVQLFEKRSGLGRKLLVAGSSGLNVSFDSPLKEFIKNYQGPEEQWKSILLQFPPEDWLKFIHSLGLETFLGTSGRYFVKGMKASALLRAWVDSLKSRGVEMVLNQECIDFSLNKGSVVLNFDQGLKEFSAVCFCLGGGSWEKTSPLWPEIFKSKDLKFNEFHPANSGFKVAWSEAFLKEAEGLPLKGVVFHSKKGSRPGEIVITNYGLEGTPIYALGQSGLVWIDLKPSLTPKEILKKVLSGKENLSPLRRIKKYLNLPPASLALIFHCTPKDELNDLDRLIGRIKKFPIELGERQSLEEAISSSGGIDWVELNNSLMLKRYPGIFVAGEMINWDAPTGGFLIQGCVSQGFVAGQGILEYLQKIR